MFKKKKNQIIYGNFIQCGKCGTVVYAGLGHAYCPFCGISMLHQLEYNRQIDLQGFLGHHMYW